MTIPDPFDSLERGIARAKYVHIIAPISAAVGAAYALSTNSLGGVLIAVPLFVYTVVWLFANGSTAVLIIVSNWSEIKAVRARGTRRSRQETLSEEEAAAPPNRKGYEQK